MLSATLLSTTAATVASPLNNIAIPDPVQHRLSCDPALWNDTITCLYERQLYLPNSMDTANTSCAEFDAVWRCLIPCNCPSPQWHLENSSHLWQEMRFYYERDCKPAGYPHLLCPPSKPSDPLTDITIPDLAQHPIDCAPARWNDTATCLQQLQELPQQLSTPLCVELEAIWHCLHPCMCPYSQWDTKNISDQWLGLTFDFFSYCYQEGYPAPVCEDSATLAPPPLTNISIPDPAQHQISCETLLWADTATCLQPYGAHSSAASCAELEAVWDCLRPCACSASPGHMENSGGQWWYQLIAEYARDCHPAGYPLPRCESTEAVPSPLTSIAIPDPAQHQIGCAPLLWANATTCLQQQLLHPSDHTGGIPTSCAELQAVWHCLRPCVCSAPLSPDTNMEWHRLLLEFQRDCMPRHYPVPQCEEDDGVFTCGNKTRSYDSVWRVPDVGSVFRALPPLRPLNAFNNLCDAMNACQPICAPSAFANVSDVFHSAPFLYQDMPPTCVHPVSTGSSYNNRPANLIMHDISKVKHIRIGQKLDQWILTFYQPQRHLRVGVFGDFAGSEEEGQFASMGSWALHELLHAPATKTQRYTIIHVEPDTPEEDKAITWLDVNQIQGGAAFIAFLQLSEPPQRYYTEAYIYLRIKAFGNLQCFECDRSETCIGGRYPAISQTVPPCRFAQPVPVFNASDASHVRCACLPGYTGNSSRTAAVIAATEQSTDDSTTLSCDACPAGHGCSGGFQPPFPCPDCETGDACLCIGGPDWRIRFGTSTMASLADRPRAVVIHARPRDGPQPIRDITVFREIASNYAAEMPPEDAPQINPETGEVSFIVEPYAQYYYDEWDPYRSHRWRVNERVRLLVSALVRQFTHPLPLPFSQDFPLHPPPPPVWDIWVNGSGHWGEDNADCPPGRDCTAGDPLVRNCPLGKYCVLGRVHDCPSHGTVPLAREYVQRLHSHLVPYMHAAHDRHFCTRCRHGYLQNGTDEHDAVQCVDCPAGQTCSNGTAHDCPSANCTAANGKLLICRAEVAQCVQLPAAAQRVIGKFVRGTLAYRFAPVGGGTIPLYVARRARAQIVRNLGGSVADGALRVTVQLLGSGSGSSGNSSSERRSAAATAATAANVLMAPRRFLLQTLDELETQDGNAAVSSMAVEYDSPDSNSRYDDIAEDIFSGVVTSTDGYADMEMQEPEVDVNVFASDVPIPADGGGNDTNNTGGRIADSNDDDDGGKISTQVLLLIVIPIALAFVVGVFIGPAACLYMHSKQRKAVQDLAAEKEQQQQQQAEQQQLLLMQQQQHWQMQQQQHLPPRSAWQQQQPLPSQWTSGKTTAYARLPQ